MLQKQELVEKVEVFPDGELHVHRLTTISEDGREIMRRQDIEKIPRGGNLPKGGGLVATIASAVWSASAVQDALRDPNYKKGALYYIGGPDITKPMVQPRSGAAVAMPDIVIADPKAAKIKHRGKEHGSSSVNYGGSAAIVAETSRKPIKHRGKEQR